MTPPVLVTPPAETPISVAEVRARSRVGDDVPSTIIDAMIQAATARLDGWSGTLGRALVDQVWQQDFSYPCRSFMRLPFAGAKDATAVVIDREGIETPATIRLCEDVIGPMVFVDSCQGAAGTLRVTFTAGYGDPEDVPAPIREAIHLYVQNMADTAFGSGLIRTETVEGIGSTGYFTPEEACAPMIKLADDMVRQYRRGNL